MISTRPLRPSILSDFRSQVTGRAFSTSLFCQAPPPKPFLPPIMIRPQPCSWTQVRRAASCSAVKLSRGTLARMMQSKPLR